MKSRSKVCLVILCCLLFSACGKKETSIIGVSYTHLSMVGAMAAALERGYGVEEMLRYAVAVSSANAMNLETGYFRQEDMEENLKQVTVEKIG